MFTCKILQKKKKMPKFATKNALFKYFWPKITYLGDFGLEFEKNIVTFEITILEFVLGQGLVQN